MPDFKQDTHPTPNDQRATVKNSNSREYELDAKNRKKQAEANQQASKRK